MQFTQDALVQPSSIWNTQCSSLPEQGPMGLDSQFRAFGSSLFSIQGISRVACFDLLQHFNWISQHRMSLGVPSRQVRCYLLCRGFNRRCVSSRCRVVTQRLGRGEFPSNPSCTP